MTSTSPADPAPPEAAGKPNLKISGKLTVKELKRITRNMRSSILGPTVVYYAGVTGPAITAAMATVVAAALARAGWAENWVLMISAIVASMAGISWYLIFMRLSYRHAPGRSSEATLETFFEADDAGICWQRGAVQTRIAWSGIEEIVVKRSFIQIRARGVSDMFAPKSWFENRAAMKVFGEKLNNLRLQASS